MLYNFIFIFQLFWNLGFPQAKPFPLFPLEKHIKSAGSDCRCIDSLALIKLYETTQGTNWTKIWDLNSPLEDWDGITTTNGACVNGITLNNNNLVGYLPKELAEIEFLKKISLGNNQLNGELPAEYGDLKHLESINLRNNQLSGSLPISFGKLTKLSSLNLSINELTGEIPVQIRNARAISGLFLNQNQFSGSIPNGISDLTELVALNLSVNHFNGPIPDEIGDLVKLTGLGLNDNLLTGEIPVSLGNLVKMVSLRLENNQLSGSIPDEIGNLQNLESIFLSGNNLSGCYPESLKNICEIGERTALFGTGYSFQDNPLLPWEGDFTQFCNGTSQTGAGCNDGKSSSTDDAINSACFCTQREITEVTPIEIALDIVVTSTCPNEDKGAIELTVRPVGDIYQIEWSDNRGTAASFTGSDLLLENLISGQHQLNIISNTDPSINLQENIEIPIKNCFDQNNIPQVITPNGDGFNERFIFDELEGSPDRFSNNELIIFNRWGNTVYQAQPYQNEWTGNNQTGQKLPEGTYYYVLRLDLNEGLIIKGDITILR